MLIEVRKAVVRLVDKLEGASSVEAVLDGWHTSASGDWDAYALFIGAQWRASKRDFADALERAQRLVDEFPDQQAGPVILAFVERMGALQKTWEEGDRQLETAYELAGYRSDVNDHEGALECIDTAITKAREHSGNGATADIRLIGSLYYRMSLSKEALGDLTAALEAVKEALALEGLRRSCGATSRSARPTWRRSRPDGVTRGGERVAREQPRGGCGVSFGGVPRRAGTARAARGAVDGA